MDKIVWKIKGINKEKLREIYVCLYKIGCVFIILLIKDFI